MISDKSDLNDAIHYLAEQIMFVLDCNMPSKLYRSLWHKRWSQARNLAINV